jgi:ABC-type multidrug transport system fused ATPase/permease subunit
MSKLSFVLCCLVFGITCVAWQSATAQEKNESGQQNQSGQAEQGEPVEQQNEKDDKSLQDKAEDLKDQANEKLDEVKKSVDESEGAKDAAESILNPIYKLVESFGKFSSFYWVAFALMSAGVVSYAFQLILGKLFMLAKGRFSFAEVLSDALGLVISVVGLGLATQAATENSTFTNSAFAVLSSAIVGLIVGIIMFVWGVRLESRASRAK